MKILIAPQTFKGSVSALDVASAVAKGVLRVIPNAQIVLLPLADGGEGTLDVLIHTFGGTLFATEASGPLGECLEVPWGVTVNSLTIIEAAKICGLTMLPPEKRNPNHTTTFGLGEVIKSALDKGMRDFFIGIGDSAVNDGGTGMAKALGVRFLDSEGRDLPLGGGALSQLRHIDTAGLDPRIKESSFLAGCDVINPLIGNKGASLTFSRQKGATKEMSLCLENGLTNFANIVKQDLNIEVSHLRCGGAAGGTGAGLHAFLNADLQIGIDWIMEKIEFSRLVEDVDLIITGEGCIDIKTSYGKTAFGVANAAKSKRIPVIAISGMFGSGAEELHNCGIDAIIPISFARVAPPENSFELIAQASEEALRCLYIGKNMNSR